MDSLDDIIKIESENRGICRNCRNLISRVIVPHDIEMFNLDLDQSYSMEEDDIDIIEDGEDILVLHYYCTAMLIDINEKVLSCSKFNNNVSLLKSDPW